jgi:hypothetical protein
MKSNNPLALLLLRLYRSKAAVSVLPKGSIDVKARNLGPEVFEVVLTINATARALGEPVISSRRFVRCRSLAFRDAI